MNESESAESLPLDPPLSAEEARVLGCLIEKESATPENYPLTLNATVTACNQKTSRDPVMKLEPGRVGQILRSLEQRGLVRSDYGARAARYQHRLDSALKLTAAQRVLIGLLLLRGPQTLAELLNRSARLHRFDDLDEVLHQLERLAGREPPLAVRLPHAPGQREDRYMHRLGGPVTIPVRPDRPLGGPSSRVDDGRAADALAERVARLEARVAALESLLQ